MEEVNLSSPLGKLLHDLVSEKVDKFPDYSRPVEVETENGTYGYLHMENNDDIIYVWEIEPKF